MASELCCRTALFEHQGRREGREPAAPMARLQKKNAGGSHHRFGWDIPALPARWAYDLYALSLGTGLVCPHRPRCAEHISELDLSIGARTTRLRRPACHQPSRADAPWRHTGHRIPHPTLVTTREAPLFDERGTPENLDAICPTVQAETVRQTGTTGSLGMAGMRDYGAKGGLSRQLSGAIACYSTGSRPHHPSCETDKCS